MDKNKFIKELEENLIEGGIGRREIDDTIKYYKEYFDEKNRQGYSVSDVIEEIGDARLIAKTIIDTSSSSKRTHRSSDYDSKTHDTNAYGRNDYSSEAYNSYDYGNNAGNQTKVFTIKNRIVSTLIAVAIILVLIIGFVFTLKIAITLLPFILIIGLVYYLFK